MKPDNTRNGSSTLAKHTTLPEAPELVTKPWLSKALGYSEPTKESGVKAFRRIPVGVETSFSGQIARFELAYGQNAPDNPASLVAKFSHADPEVRLALFEEFERETRFYEEIAGIGDMPVPVSYYSATDPETGVCALLLEDLSHMRSVNLVHGCSQAESELVVSQLAKFHASWWNDPRLQQIGWMPAFEDFVQSPYQEWLAQYPQKVAELLPDFRLPSSFLRLCGRFGENMASIFHQLSAPPVTCVHRDTHGDNILFGVRDDDPPLVMFDWSYVGMGRGVYDVTYFLISSVPVEQRRCLEEELMQTYYTILLDRGVQDYSFEQCWFDYKLAAVGKLFVTVMATVLLDNSTAQRRAWRRADLQRLIAFVEDHDVGKLL